LNSQGVLPYRVEGVDPRLSCMSFDNLPLNQRARDELNKFKEMFRPMLNNNNNIPENVIKLRKAIELNVLTQKYPMSNEERKMLYEIAPDLIENTVTINLILEKDRKRAKQKTESNEFKKIDSDLKRLGDRRNKIKEIEKLNSDLQKENNDAQKKTISDKIKKEKEELEDIEIKRSKLNPKMFESTVNKSKNEIQRIIIKNQERIAREEQEQMNRFNKVNLGKSQSQRRINVNEEEDKEQDRIYVHALSDDDDNDDDEVDENETIDLGDIPDDDLNFNYEELLQKAIDINDEIAVKKLTQLSVLQTSNRRKEVDFFVRYYLDLYDKDKQETKVYKIASQISNMKDIDYVSTYLDLKSKGFL
jgi:hypothetical protein